MDSGERGMNSVIMAITILVRNIGNRTSDLLSFDTREAEHIKQSFGTGQSAWSAQVDLNRYCKYINFLRHGMILDWFELKEFAGDRLYITKKD